MGPLASSECHERRSCVLARLQSLKQSTLRMGPSMRTLLLAGMNVGVG